MPTRSKSTRGRARARTARKRTTRSTRAKNPVTVAAKQISDSVNEVRRNPRKLKTIGKVAAVAAGLLITRMLSKKK
jgi:hypothetical protein